MLRTLIVVAAIISPLLGQLTATFNGSNDQTGAHRVPLPALAHEAGATPSPYLEPGPFTVIWKGQLEVPKRLRLHFSFEGEGEAVLKINGEDVHSETDTLGQTKSDRLRLNAGLHPVEIHYTSPADGSGSFRLFWEERSFPREPVPPTAWKLPAESTTSLIEQGRTAFADQRCIRCHEANDLLSETHMPELSAMGPDLTGIGSRVSQEWLTRWIAQPDHLKPTTTMPAMVDHQTAEGAQQAADLAAYLATLHSQNEAETKTSAEKATAGGALFHQLACVACHTLPEVDVIDRENNRIPLNNVASKFLPGALKSFLKSPQAHNPWIKMPDFQLSDEEAASLAAFLTEESTGRHTPDPSEFPPGDVASGEKLAKSMNCAVCHTGLPAPENPPAPNLATLLKLPDWTTKGCLAEDETRVQAPRLILKKDDRAAINTFAHSELDSLTRTTPAHYALRQMETLNCRACHSDLGTPARLASLHPKSQKYAAPNGEEDEKIDQSRPQLTYMGEMLNTKYLEKTLRGDLAERARPWLKMRMPAFHQHSTLLATGMAQLHGMTPSGPDDTPRDEEAAAIGRTLVGLEGLACITCHGIDDMKPLAAFEVMGINFAQAHHRLQPGYFYRWLGNPHRIAPNSRMPRYTTEDGEGLRPDILEGNAQKQFEAIWEYLKAGATMEKP